MSKDECLVHSRKERIKCWLFIFLLIVAFAAFGFEVYLIFFSRMNITNNSNPAIYEKYPEPPLNINDTCDDYDDAFEL